MNSLRHVIQACLGEGDYHSSGHFSVEKNLPAGVNHWSLDVLRALVRRGCQSLDIHQHRRELWIVGHAKERMAGAHCVSLLGQAPGLLHRGETSQVTLVQWGNGATEQTVKLRGHRHCPRIYPYIRSSGWSLGLYVKFECVKPIPLTDLLADAVRFCPVPVMVHSNDGGVGQIDLRGQHHFHHSRLSLWLLEVRRHLCKVARTTCTFPGREKLEEDRFAEITEKNAARGKVPAQELLWSIG